MIKTFFHPGFPKTATTTIQDYFFARHPDIASLAQPYFQSDPEIEKLLLEPDGYCDQNRLEELVRRVDTAHPDAKVRVFSDEASVYLRELRQPIATRLHKLFPDGEVLFTLRNQLDCISSYYAAGGRMLRNAPFPYKGRHVTLENYLTHAMNQWGNSFLAIVDFADCIRFYEELFGKDKIHILLFEEFIRDPKEYIEQLCSILSIDSEGAFEIYSGGHSNPRPTERMARYHKFRSWLLPGVPVRKIMPGGEKLHITLTKILNKGAVHNVDIPGHWRSRLGECYRDGNRRLMEDYNLPLDQYGYPL